MMQRDIVDVLLKRVLEYSTRSEGSFTEDMARQIEREIRGDYGGSDEHIRKISQDEIERRHAAKVDIVVNGMSVKDASRKHGIARSTIYYLLDK
jgi:hypothetical protein